MDSLKIKPQGLIKSRPNDDLELHSISENLGTAALKNPVEAESAIEMSAGRETEKNCALDSNEDTMQRVNTIEDNGDNVSMTNSAGKVSKLNGKW